MRLEAHFRGESRAGAHLTITAAEDQRGADAATGGHVPHSILQHSIRDQNDRQLTDVRSFWK
jgi:hypothetical protein